LSSSSSQLQIQDGPVHDSIYVVAAIIMAMSDIQLVPHYPGLGTQHRLHLSHTLEDCGGCHGQESHSKTYVFLIKSKPHFAGVNCASFAVSTVGKGNVLVTKGVLDEVKHIIGNSDPTTGAMGALEVTALTDALDNGHLVATPPTTIAISQEKVVHGRPASGKKNDVQNFAIFKNLKLRS
jgi:hypothetical protein